MTAPRKYAPLDRKAIESLAKRTRPRFLIDMRSDLSDDELEILIEGVRELYLWAVCERAARHLRAFLDMPKDARDEHVADDADNH